MLLSAACREELNQPLFAAIDAFEYPELHDESIAARNFYRHVSKLMLACGVKDFGMKVGQDYSSAAAALPHTIITRAKGLTTANLDSAVHAAPAGLQDIIDLEPISTMGMLS